MSETWVIGGTFRDYEKTIKAKQEFLLGKGPTEKEMISVLKSSDKRFQRVGLAAMSLKPVETNQLIEILFDFLQNRAPEFRRHGWYAMISLDKFTKFPESKKADLGKQLLEIIRNDKDDVLPLPQRFDILAKFPSEETVVFLTEQMMKEGKERHDRSIRFAAFRALKKMGDSYYDKAAEYVNEHGSDEIKKELREQDKAYREIKQGVKGS